MMRSHATRGGLRASLTGLGRSGVCLFASTGPSEKDAAIPAALDDSGSLLLEKPKEPGPEDCCQTGCRECVWDTYWQDLKAYEAKVNAAQGKPPPLDPFEELERRLAGETASSGGS